MNCLVTKLKGTVNDNSLPKLGSMLFKLETTTTSLVKIEAIGKDVSFSSADGSNVLSTSSNGDNKTNVVNVSEINTVFYIDASKGVTISIDNKYNLEKLDVSWTTNPNELTVDLNFEDLKYCKKLSWLALYSMTLTGDISALQNLTALTAIRLFRTQVSGDISVLSGLTALTDISLDNTEVSGDISELQNLTALTAINLNNTGVSGDISALSRLTALTAIRLFRTQVSGDISVLSGLTALTAIDLNSTQVSGDISALQNLTALTAISLYSTEVSGSLDSLANLPSGLTFNIGNKTLSGDYFKFLNEHTNSDVVCSGNFNYTTKSWSGKSYRRVGGDDFTCNNLDNFLNDFQVVSVSNTNIYVSPSIKMKGTRTSASDSAIATLQGKGFTVTVPVATDANAISLMSARTNENFGIAYKDKELIVEPVDLTKMVIVPASGVTVKTFDTKENAEKFIEDNRFV